MTIEMDERQSSVLKGRILNLVNNIEEEDSKGMIEENEGTNKDVDLTGEDEITEHEEMIDEEAVGSGDMTQDT